MLFTASLKPADHIQHTEETAKSLGNRIANIHTSRKLKSTGGRINIRDRIRSNNNHLKGNTIYFNNS